jgi:site-specific recombinase XerD
MARQFLSTNFRFGDLSAASYASPTLDTTILPVISWHIFRHTYAPLLGEVAASLRTAQAILGHSDLKTTLNVYTHPIPESQ